MRLEALLLALLVIGCDRTTPPEESQPAVAAVAEAKEVTLKHVVAMRKEGSAVLVDCNDRASRVERGTVPGATLLKNPPRIGDELPADKDAALVFYCWNEY